MISNQIFKMCEKIQDAGIYLIIRKYSLILGIVTLGIMALGVMTLRIMS